MIPTVTSINIKNCLQIRGEAKRPEPPDRCSDSIQNVNLQNFAVKFKETKRSELLLFAQIKILMLSKTLILISFPNAACIFWWC